MSTLERKAFSAKKLNQVSYLIKCQEQGIKIWGNFSFSLVPTYKFWTWKSIRHVEL